MKTKLLKPNQVSLKPKSKIKPGDEVKVLKIHGHIGTINEETGIVTKVREGNVAVQFRGKDGSLIFKPTELKKVLNPKDKK